jgi:hypothetical protein
LPGIFQSGKSKIYLSLHVYNDGLISDRTILKENMLCIDSTNSQIQYKNGKSEDGVEYVEKYWSLTDLEAIAQKNGYYTAEFQDMINNWKVKKYFYDKTKISIENYYSFYAKWDTRLDFNGTTPEQTILSENYINKTDLVFPIEKSASDGESCWALSEFKEKTTADKIQRILVR